VIRDPASEDLDSYLQRCAVVLAENAGIEVHGRKGDPHCVYFHDPDGHQLQFLLKKE